MDRLQLPEYLVNAQTDDFSHFYDQDLTEALEIEETRCKAAVDALKVMAETGNEVVLDEQS